MMKMRTIIAYFMIFTFIAIFSVTKAESYDSEAIFQVSKGLAEWKLMSDTKSETQVEQIVYVSSSLKGFVEKGKSERVAVVQGLSGFDNDYWIESQIRQWELNRGIEISNRYMANLPTFNWYDFVTSQATSIVQDWTINEIGNRYMRIGQVYNDTANFFRAQRGLGSTDIALQNTVRGLRIYNTVSTVMNATINAADIFIKTVDYVGKSMQVMNPPIYLQNNPKFTPSQKILGVPISGTWETSGSYNIPSGVVNYQETLKTSAPGHITQTHRDWVTTDMGTYYRQVEIKTPATSGFERFVVTHYPVGHYFDPTSSSVIIARIQQSHRIGETIGGISKVTSLPSSGIGNRYGGVGSNRNSPPPTFNATGKTVEIGPTTFKYPSIDWTSIPKATWNIPSTNWSILTTTQLPIYKPSIPKILTYTPSIPTNIRRCIMIPRRIRSGNIIYTEYDVICN